MAEDREDRREPGGGPRGDARRAGLWLVRERLEGRRVVLTTHVNADGDGIGSEAALARFLHRRGTVVSVVNPTPVPEHLAFLLDGVPHSTPSEAQGRADLEEADVVALLDTAELHRIGGVAPRIEDREVVVVDHHPPVGAPPGEPAVRDPGAAATGELIWDLIEGAGDEPTREECEGLYVALATDTGSFRFSNTSARVHRIVAGLLERGVDVEEMYRHLYRQGTAEGVRLLQRALASLEVHPELPVAWVSLARRDFEESGASLDDLEGIVEHPRQLRGVEVGLLFRETPDGRTKVSLRSSGSANVAEVARSLGGGGHAKAAGALVDAPLEEGRRRVLEALEAAF